MKLLKTKWGVIGLSAVALLAAVSAWLALKGPEQAAELPQGTVLAHYFEKPNLNLSNIKLKVFYAVPKDMSSQIPNDWKDGIEITLEKASEFHAVQFHGSSKLEGQIYPQPVILEKDSINYDTENTNYGNPEGLRRILPELKQRFPDFLKTGQDEYGVAVIVYEGVGAAGMPAAMIISRTYLSDEQYKDYRVSLFYHELGHTIGLPDEYDYETNDPSLNDIMGRGRTARIETNYLDPKLLKGLGVFVK